MNRERKTPANPRSRYAGLKPPEPEKAAKPKTGKGKTARKSAEK